MHVRQKAIDGRLADLQDRAVVAGQEIRHPRPLPCQTPADKRETYMRSYGVERPLPKSRNSSTALSVRPTRKWSAPLTTVVSVFTQDERIGLAEDGERN